MIGWIVGVACMGQQYAFMPSLGLISCMLLMALMGILFIVYQNITAYFFKFFILICSCMCSILLGFSYANHELNLRLKSRETKIEDTTVLVYVKHISQLKEKSIQQKVEVLNRKAEVVQWFASMHLETSGLELGQYYQLTGKIKPAHGYAIAGSFDVEKWYIQQNIMANFKVTSIQKVSTLDIQQQGYAHYIQQQNSFIHRTLLWIEQQRLNIRTFIQQQPIQHKGLTLALLTGDESLLNKNVEQQFQRFGMSHLLAISGPHVIIFAMMVCWCLQYLITHYVPSIYLKIPKQYLLIMPFLACVVVYCAYVGFEIPSLRTLLICMIGSVFILLQQPLRPLVLLLLSAFVLLLFDPFSVLSAAFWLSYGACFILLRIYQTVHHESLEGVSTFIKIQQYAWALVESQWKIFIALFPLMIIFFHQISWMAPLSNIFAIPWIGLVIVPLDILAGISYLFFEPLSRLFFQINDVMIAVLMWVLQCLDAVFSPQLYPIYLSIWGILGIFLALIIIFLPKGIIPKTWSVMCLMPIFFNHHTQDNIEIHLLDVGQGQAIFIRNANKTMMLDTGGSFNEDEFSIGQQVILPFLSMQNSKALDILMLSHLDQDHSGAYFKIRDQLNIQHLYANERIEGAQTTQLCQAGDRLNLGSEINLQVLSPSVDDLAKAKFEKNEMSCIVYLQIPHAYPYQSYLFMGDAGWATEFKLLQQYPDLHVDVLVLGHHGSQHSSAYNFLKQLNPKLVLISAGFDNRYGHPSSKTIQRLQALQIPYLTTIHSGSIQLMTAKNGQVKMSSYRAQKSWHDFPAQ